MTTRFEKAVKENIIITDHGITNDVLVYKVSSKGNTYIITIDKKIECTCFDYKTRGEICKHIHLIMLKIHRLVLDFDANINEKQKKFLIQSYLKFYSEIPEMRNKNENCVICLDIMDTNGNTVCKTCNNGFHTKCVQEYRKYNCNCPLCREVL